MSAMAVCRFGDQSVRHQDGRGFGLCFAGYETSCDARAQIR
jgi:hypothetical protein